LDLKILIIDDSETTRRLLRAIVDTRSWTICGEADNGMSGLEQFGELRPDVVVIDLALPDINGLEVAKKISALDRSVPLVLCTALDLEGLEEPARQAGFCKVFHKVQIWNLIVGLENAVMEHHRSNEEQLKWGISVSSPNRFSERHTN
jgi:two-component system chemotaxis response regulator CheY